MFKFFVFSSFFKSSKNIRHFIFWFCSVVSLNIIINQAGILLTFDYHIKKVSMFHVLVSVILILVSFMVFKTWNISCNGRSLRTKYIPQTQQKRKYFLLLKKIFDNNKQVKNSVSFQHFCFLKKNNITLILSHFNLT